MTLVVPSLLLHFFSPVRRLSLRVRITCLALVASSLGGPGRHSPFASALSSPSNTRGMDRPSVIVRFITNKMCPFAQKAWLALECSGCQYQLEEISLYGSGGKPSWFWDLNPQGTVPVLVAGREGREEPTILPDSDLILDEFEKENGSDLNWKVSLLPDDSSVRRRVCEWRKLVNTKLIPAGKKAVLGGSKDGMRRVLQQMDGMLTTTYLAGDSVTTADCHVFPFLWRLHQEFGLSDYPNLQRWVEQCQQQSAFRRTIQKAWWWWWW